MPGIRDDFHDFVNHLKSHHIDFRVAAIRDEWSPGSHDIFPSDENTPFPFSGVMEAAEIHGWIDSLTTSGKSWAPTTGYDSLMLVVNADVLT